MANYSSSSIAGRLPLKRRAKEMHDLRDKLINRRKDIYRNFACEIARDYTLVRIVNLQLKDMAKVKRNDGLDTKLTDNARKNRNRAALAELTLYIQQACIKIWSVSREN